MDNLPGVVNDEKELKEVLKNYQQVVINGSKNVLEDLREIVQGCKQKEYERIHFHFSGKIFIRVVKPEFKFPIPHPHVPSLFKQSYSFGNPLALSQTKFM